MTNPLFSSPGVLRPMLRLALPVLAEESLNILVGYTDWWLTGRFLADDEYKAAMGLMAYTMWLLPSLFAAVAIGATAMVSRFVGGGNSADASRAANQAMLLGVLIAILATIAAFVGAGAYVSAMQLRGEAAQLAMRYLRIVSLVIGAIMIEQVGAACLRGAGDMVTGLLAKIVVNVVNVSLSASLVLGLGPFPKLGWEGLAIGTACGHGIGGLILLVVLARGRAGLKLRFAEMAPHGGLLRRLVRVGTPGGVDTLAVVACHLVYASIINHLGVLAAAAHGLGVQIEALAYLTGAAFQAAAATMAGQYLGANDPQRATRGVVMATAVGGGVMLLASLAFFFAGDHLTAFFTDSYDDPTSQLTSRLLKIVAFSTPPLALLQILSGALRGAGDTRWPLAFTFIGLIVVRLPLALWMAWPAIELPLLGIEIPGLGWGVWGAWIAMLIDIALRSALVTARFLQGGWKHIRV